MVRYDRYMTTSAVVPCSFCPNPALAWVRDYPDHSSLLLDFDRNALNPLRQSVGACAACLGDWCAGMVRYGRSLEVEAVPVPA